MSSRKPNILLVMVDQLAAQFLPAYGNRVVNTPHLDRLASQGIVFENAYSPSPLCAPARAIVMNGLLPSRTGVYDNAAEFPSAIPTWAHYLRKEGYRTCLSGKMHFVGPDQLHGFEERLTTDIYPADFGWTPDWRLRGERIDWWYHNMTSVKQAGIAEITNQLEYDDEVCFLARRKIFDYVRYDSDKAFCLMVSFTHPHDPYAARAKFWNLYRDNQIDMPVTPKIPYSDLDPHSQRLHDMSAMDEFEIDDDDVRSSRHGYYANISYVDDLLGQLLSTLQETGQLEKTVVLFTSDHGDFLGERGLWYKMSFFDPSSRVPLIAWSPERFAPRRVTQPVSLCDLLPTIAALGSNGQAEIVRKVDGRSLLPILEGENEDENTTVWGEYLAEGAIAPCYMARRGKWKFIHSPADPDQLFDLENDPHEITNLASTEAGAAVARTFRSEIESEFDIDRIHREVMQSQQSRHLMFQALQRGEHFPWDFQPLKKASEQYTRNHLAVTERDQLSRFPPAAPITDNEG